MVTYKNIEKIDIDSREFPGKLRNIPNPPKQLYCAGNLELLHKTSIGVVGSRKFTLYGKQVALMIGKKFAQAGIPVVSGLAYGIDAYAHQGVLEGGGEAICVLGSGLKKMSPARNRQLMYDLLDTGGLVLSEYEPELEAESWTFPARNRIISGLSKAVVVVEANYNSGALITAQHANEQGRTVYAVPGNINSQFSLGSNLLIRDGATPLIIIDDVIRDIGGVISLDKGDISKLDSDEIAVVNEIKKYNGATPDQVAEALGMMVGSVNSIVTILEIKGVVEVYCGKIHLAKEI